MAKHLAPSNDTGQPPRRVRVPLPFMAAVSLFCAVYLEFAYEIAGASRTGIAAGVFYGTVTLGCAVRLGIAFAGLLLLMIACCRTRRVAPFVAKYRIPLAIALFACLVILGIHGSSLALWGDMLGEERFAGTLFGMPRTLRSDEWLVFTPFSFSQVATGNQALSPVIRGGMTDVSMVYAQPAWTLSTVFRPFLWGYLFLDAARGLAFYWCGRAIALVLVSYACFLLISNNNRWLAAYAALLVGFAPIIEWWFAVNGTAELFIFGQGLVLALHRLLRSETAPARLGHALMLAWQLGCFAFILYPAWQVLMVYVFGALGIWDVLVWRSETEPGTRLRALGKALVPLLACIALVVGAAVFCVSIAWDTLQAVMHTAYPGERVSTGGGLMPLLPNVTPVLLSALWPDLFVANACETSTFVSLFPTGILCALAITVRGAIRRRLDTCLVLAMLVYALFMAFGVVGFPPMLAKLSLLSLTTTNRLPLAIGYLDVVLLVRSLAIMEQSWQERAATERTSDGLSARHLCSVPLIVALVLGYVLVARQHNPELMGIKATVLLAAAMALLALPVLLPRSLFDANGNGKGPWLVCSALVVVACSMCVNPLQRGADSLLKSETIDTVGQVASQDPDALWLTDDAVLGQACITAGAPAITSVNVYPDLDRWHAIDPEGTYEDTYNRYAHIRARLGDELVFETPQPDVFTVTLTPDDAVALGATYWLSHEDLEAHNTDRVVFTQLQKAGNAWIYRIDRTA